MDGRVIDFNELRVPRPPRQVIVFAVSALALIIVATSVFFQVQPEEVGVVLRFGRFVRISEPGLRTKLPFLETVYKVPVQRQLKQEFGFRTVDAGVRTRYAEKGYEAETLMLTGDLNVALVEWIVQYRVTDSYKYLFKVRNHVETFRYLNEAVMRQAVGDRTVTEVLTVGRQEIETFVQASLQELSNQYEMGIAVDQVVLQDVNPPDPVKPSWDEVNQAQQQQDRLINEAKADYNKVVPRAEGEAQQTVLQAEGYALDRVNSARGDAARFSALYEEYRRAPDVTRRRLQLETMQNVLPEVGQRLLLDETARGVLPLLNLQGAAISPTPAAGGGR